MAVQTSAQDYVLRALAASEIAESCTDPQIRKSFFDLAEAWLEQAGKADEGSGPARDAPGYEARVS